MNFATLLSTYLLFQALIAIAYLISRFSARVQLTAIQSLIVNKLGIFLVVVLSLLSPLIRTTPVFEPPMKIWSAESRVDFDRSFRDGNGAGYVKFSEKEATPSLSTRTLGRSIFGVFGVLILFAVARLAFDLEALWRIRKNSFLLRRQGRVSIFAHNEITVPFSYWVPGHANVVVPTGLILSPENFRMAVVHELQHHRQSDTLWVYGLIALRISSFANPFAHMWCRTIIELQEFACDETLVDRKKVQARNYARCLVETAETALASKRVPACATGFLQWGEGHLLKRRIVRMLSLKKTENGRRKQTVVTASVVTMMVTALTMTAMAAGNLVQDRRVTMSDAKVWAANARVDSQFPVEVNDLVLKQLNRFLGTPEGREKMKQGLRRMETYRPMLEAKLVEYSAPSELLAVGLVESGYQNLDETKNRVRAAGLWQFIASTARSYGLRVDSEVDERLDVVKETDAAMRYLSANNSRFKHWLLSVMAYNMGENNLQKGIDKTGSRDPWFLVRSEYENDRDYLAKIVAGILIMKNPSCLD